MTAGGNGLHGFVLASITMAAIPGPGVIYIVSRTAALGRASGLASAAGVAAGNLTSAILASLGLATVLALLPGAMLGLKLLGGGYLVYVGISGLRRPAQTLACTTWREQRLGTVFKDGMVVAALNPKTAIFFAAFLPQFADPEAPFAGQVLLLGVVFVLICGVGDTLYALAASKLTQFTQDSERLAGLGRMLSCVCLVGLGLATVLVS